MNIEYIEIHKNEWLTDALTRGGYDDMIPSNVILNKTLTGIGATRCELYAHRNSIIIEPNVPVIQCKLENEDLCLLGVFAGIRPASIRRYLIREDIRYKKILTTPESFYKVRNEAQKLGINLYGDDWFCLFDECEKITQDHDYRRSISQPISDFFRFSCKAMVSATPLMPSHPEFEAQQFRIIKVRPTFNYKRNLTLIVTNSFSNVLRKLLEKMNDSECVCIFLNKTDAISAIITELGLKEYKVFCSEKSVTKLHKQGIHKAQSAISYPLAKYNFFTCRFYSGLDINILPIKPDIIMLSDLRIALFTMIDPLTEAIQIQGRFRGGDDRQPCNSIIHIATVNPDMLIKSREELDIEISQYADNYNRLKEQYQNENNDVRKSALIKDLNNLNYNDLLDEKSKISHFAIDNLYNEERVKSYYLSGETLKRAYDESNYFNVTYINSVDLVGHDTITRISRTRNCIEQRKLIVRILEELRIGLICGRLDNNMVNPYMELLMQIEETSYILPIFQKIGITGIEECRYQKSLLNKAITLYEKQESEKLRFRNNVLVAIHEAFELGIYMSKEEIKSKIKKIYADFQIKCKVRQDTIKDYYEVSERNSLDTPSFKLNRFKFDGGFFEVPP